MTTVQVELGRRTYPIEIGEGLLADGALLRRALRAEQLMIVTNETVAPLYLAQLLGHFADRACHTVILPDGEAHKTLASFEQILGAMVKQRFERKGAVVALGGGVVGDLAGFAAACYQRGVDYVQIPTTLLAQVDSAVGGKTAVNHPLGKNMIGAFHQPVAVIADTRTLSSLPDRELSAGLAEVIKYGLIGDRPFFEWLEVNVERLLSRDPEALAYAVTRSCRNKAEVVSADEREAGIRATLNLGHTFGHAIEAAMDYGKWLHGEAVAAGMLMAADLSRRMGWLDREDCERIEALLSRARLPLRAPAEISQDTFIKYMSLDKKNIGGTIRLVLLKTLGEACVTQDYDQNKLRETLAQCRGDGARET